MIRTTPSGRSTSEAISATVVGTRASRSTLMCSGASEPGSLRLRVAFTVATRSKTRKPPQPGWKYRTEGTDVQVFATGGDASAYHYLLSGVRAFPGARQFAEEIGTQGFVEVGYERLSFGIVAIHTARKPR